MKNFKFVLFLLLFCSTLSFAEDIAKNIGILKSLTGTVNAKRSEQIVKLSVGDMVLKKDIIVTGAKSKVNIVFNDGSIVTLGENSILNIDKYVFKPAKKNFDIELSLKKGISIFESGKIGKLAPEKFKFNIPSGIIGIRGTKFLVEVKE